jgi:CIC family chloride channel protein
VEAALRRVQDVQREDFVVRMTPSGWGYMGKATLKTLVSEGKGELSLGSVVPIRQLPCLYPDLPLESALRHVYQVPLVPVLHRADPRKLEGTVSRADVMKKYQLWHED